MSFKYWLQAQGIIERYILYIIMILQIIMIVLFYIFIFIRPIDVYLTDENIEKAYREIKQCQKLERKEEHPKNQPQKLEQQEVNQNHLGLK